MSKEKQQANDMPSLNQKDDALFEALGKSKKKKRRKVIRTVISIVLIAALVLVISNAPEAGGGFPFG